MSHLNPGLLSTYNSLTDKHLAGYFSNTRIRRHLQRVGLITRSGRIVPDKEYRHKLIQRAHQRHVRECLAQAIFHKVLEMERLHQIDIKRKLEEFARRERVHKIKVERSKRYEEGIVHILSPHPPVGARGIRKQHSGPEGEHSESSESPSSSRPNTAPGKMQRPVRLKPIHSNSTTASARRSSPSRLLDSSHENHLPFNGTMEKEPRRRLTAVEASHGISPYCLPVINNFVTPVPPATKRKERGLKGTASSTVRGRRLRPTTASSGADDTPLLRSSVHQSRVCVNMVYFGKTVRLSSDLTDMRDDVKVFQQHCGGENLCVYKGKLHEGETFRFISHRHRGFPFSLTFFLNGLQVERLSSCCEFKHRKGSRLGGKHGHFGFASVEGASPCYKCIIAMGLDKKPTPPPKTIKEDTRSEESVDSPKDKGEMEMERTGKDAGSHLEVETSEPQNRETPVKEETAPDEEKGRDDYDEDFEADDEGPAEEANKEKSPSPSSETDRQVKEKDASETENDDRDDMRSHSGSSSSGSEHEESDAEATRDINEDEKEEQQKEDSQEETIAQPEEKDEPNPEEVVATEAESSAARDSYMDSAGNSTEIEIPDTSAPSGSETRQSDDKDAEKRVEEGKQEEEQERAKSVQEKLAEAILKESQCSSEPELSDTSTEEEEESTHKGPQPDNEDAAPEKLVTLTEQQQTIAEEAECEESDTGEVVVAQKQEDLPETKEQSGDDEQEPQENRDITEDEKVEEDDKAAEDKATEEEDKSEETGEALHPSNEENVTQDDKIIEPLEETPAETTDTEAAEKDEKKEEKTAEETDVQHDETGQGAKSSEEDESSVSEPDKKTDEAAAPDNAEAEAVTARETIEIKAESSKEQEALSYEEAPVSDAEKGEQADSEDRAAGSETEVTAENSSSSPSGSGETTVEKIADMSEENAIEETSVDDIKEEQILEDDSHGEQCDLGEEGIGASEETDEKEDKEKTEEGGKEEEKQAHVTSDKVEEDDNTEKRDDGEKVKNNEEGNEESTEDEGTDKQENAAESADNAVESNEDEEEAVKILSEEDKGVDDEKVEEPEKTESDGNGECIENKLEESEVMEGDKSESDDENETKPAVQENDDEAEKSENQNENKAEKSEDKESKNDEEDDKEKDISEKDLTEMPVEEGEGISETTKEAEKSEDVGANEAADGTKSADETPEAESVEQDAEEASKNSEKGEINAENGEVATEAESNNHEDEGESQLEDKNELKTEEEGDEESKTDGPADDESADIKEVTVESEEGAKKHEADEVDQAPGADQVEHDAEEEGDSEEKNDESTPSNAQPETAGTEMKEEPKLGDRKDSEEAEQDQNGNKSDCDNENKEPDLIKKESSTEENMDEVALVSSGNQEQSLVAVDLDVMASKLDEESKDTKSDICPQTDENAAGGDLSAADGENGVDAEDASKASEEGASVLLKPHAQNNEADNTEETVATGKESPQALAKEDSTDLVSNWVNKHQSSKFFETFVEPLEDMREEISDTPVSISNKEETKSNELPRSESPLKMVRVSQDELKGYRDEEDELQVEEKAEVKDLILKPEAEQSEEESATLQGMRSEEHRGSMGSLQECNGQESAEKGINEENAFSKTDMESTSGSHHSATGEPASVSKSQTDEKTPDNDFNVKEPQTEEGHQSTSPLGTEDVNEPWGKADEQSQEVTETNFTTSRSDDGSLGDSRNEEIEGNASDRSIKRDRKDLQLIEDIKHTLSKDRPSAFSVDDTLFAHSSYPLLTASTAESGH